MEKNEIKWRGNIFKICQLKICIHAASRDFFFFLATGNMAVTSPSAREVYIPSQNSMVHLKHDTFSLPSLFGFVGFFLPKSFWKI